MANDDDPVYTLKKVMYAVVTYANMRGVRSVDRVVELCERDLAFIWLTRGQKPKRDAFYEFKGKKLKCLLWCAITVGFVNLEQLVRMEIYRSEQILQGSEIERVSIGK